MSEEREEDLQNPADWDFEQAEEHTPKKTARAVVSVAFSRDDYEQIVIAAHEAGKKTSEFIREAVLARIDEPTAITSVRWGGQGIILATPTLDSLTVHAGTSVTVLKTS